MATEEPETKTVRQQKRSINRLVVDDVSDVVAADGDNSCILLSNEKMEELDLFRGDSVLVRGKRRKETVVIALGSDNTENGKCRMNKVIRKNLKVKLGDFVSIHPAGKVKYGKNSGHKNESLLNLNFIELTKLGIDAKMKILNHDKKEKKGGMIFEYGHTIGHALEKAYLRENNIIIPHGIGVIYGMLCCSYISVTLGYMSINIQKKHDELCHLITRYYSLPKPYPDINLIKDLTLGDSKRGVVRPAEIGNEISEVLLNAIAEPRESSTMLHKFNVDLIDKWWLELTEEKN